MDGDQRTCDTYVRELVLSDVKLEVCHLADCY
jgi:hypothetical protein